MINLPGQLAIKTIHGRNGAFNVGRLTTTLGEFVTKNAELDQYREGKYDGDFTIAAIRPSVYFSGGRMVIELRAVLSGMALSQANQLSKEDAQGISAQEVDPMDEERQEAAPSSQPTADSPPARKANPLTDTTPFGERGSKAKADAGTDQQSDAVLFGSLWPLTNVVKLDATVGRAALRQQLNRLSSLGYQFDPLSQEWKTAA